MTDLTGVYFSRPPTSLANAPAAFGVAVIRCRPAGTVNQSTCPSDRTATRFPSTVTASARSPTCVSSRARVVPRPFARSISMDTGDQARNSVPS